MILLGNPAYHLSRNLTLKELEEMTNAELIRNYLVIDTGFRFPDSVKYPSIPCFLDETSTVYPQSGRSVLTGIEYLVAKEQGCIFSEMKDIFIIPFESKKDEKGEIFYLNEPFKDIIIGLQGERAKYPKNTLGNLMEKEKANSIYGNVVKGMSNKKKFDIKTGRTIRMEGSVLSNPIIAS